MFGGKRRTARDKGIVATPVITHRIETVVSRRNRKNRSAPGATAHVRADKLPRAVTLGVWTHPVRPTVLVVPMLTSKGAQDWSVLHGGVGAHLAPRLRYTSFG